MIYARTLTRISNNTRAKKKQLTLCAQWRRRHRRRRLGAQICELYAVAIILLPSVSVCQRAFASAAGSLRCTAAARNILFAEISIRMLRETGSIVRQYVFHYYTIHFF